LRRVELAAVALVATFWICAFLLPALAVTVADE
jgi:hypothetical protein